MIASSPVEFKRPNYTDNSQTRIFHDQNLSEWDQTSFAKSEQVQLHCVIFFSYLTFFQFNRRRGFSEFDNHKSTRSSLGQTLIGLQLGFLGARVLQFSPPFKNFVHEIPSHVLADIYIYMISVHLSSISLPLRYSDISSSCDADQNSFSVNLSTILMQFGCFPLVQS